MFAGCPELQPAMSFSRYALSGAPDAAADFLDAAKLAKLSTRTHIRTVRRRFDMRLAPVRREIVAQEGENLKGRKGMGQLGGVILSWRRIWREADRPSLPAAVPMRAVPATSLRRAHQARKSSFLQNGRC